MSDTEFNEDLFAALHALTLAHRDADRAMQAAVEAEERAVEARAAATKAAAAVGSLSLGLGPVAAVLGEKECLAFNGHILVPVRGVAGNPALRLLTSVGTLDVEHRLRQRRAERAQLEAETASA
jgi:hypothetical protein